jgi:hypothetical protein
MRRWLPIALFLLAPKAAACTVTIADPPQVLVRRAALVAEATGTRDPFAFEITKLWKGMASPRVRLWGFSFQKKCEPERMGVEGKRYLILVDAAGTRTDGPETIFNGKPLAYSIENAGPLLDYLEHPVDITTHGMRSMLNAWKDRTVSDEKFAQWLQATVPVAQVHDWAVLYFWTEVSVTLNVLRGLDARLNDARGFETLSCERDGLREEIVPKLLEILEAKRVTPELVKELEDVWKVTGDELCARDAEPAAAEGLLETSLEVLP